ncbi:MYG1 family protein [Candidatus Parcubacteria bacterium]|nr:MYG1 family protein [Candidatus Parcubacteria bacterium]
MKIVTHHEHFHTDDLLAVAALLIKYPGSSVMRTRDQAIIESADIVVDVGGVYDPAKLRFDHHQLGGAGKRTNGIPYASIGLVWKEFGEELAGGKEEALIIEEDMIVSVDALDNGVDIATPKFTNVSTYSLGDFFESFVDGAKTLEDFDEKFHEALIQATALLERQIRDAKKLAADWREVRKIYEATSDKRIIIIPLHTAWKHPLVPSDAQFVIYPRANGNWSAQAVNKSLDTYESKKPFPAAWAGLRDDDLARVSGIRDAVFCHSSRFLSVAQSQESALKLAEIALNS